MSPRFSIVTPIYETPPGVLRKMLRSVLRQRYEDWELCLVDDGSKQPHVREILSARPPEIDALLDRFVQTNEPSRAGALIVVLEGLQQLQQYQQNWITYRSTCERLKHEKFLFAARAGPYASSEPEALLAERVESLVSQEHAAWVSQREDAAARRVGNSQ